jgi:hypothetical protein
VWRKLKRLGVAQVAAGVVALPYDAATKEQLEWIAQEVVDSGGMASIWITTPTVKRFGEDLAHSLSRERAVEYQQLAKLAEANLTDDPADRQRAHRQLRSEFRRIERRDHFPPPEKADAQQALQRLAGGLDRERIQ